MKPIVSTKNIRLTYITRYLFNGDSTCRVERSPVMKPFVFSADSHIMEPADLFLEGLPASLKDHAIHSRKEGEYLITGTKDKIIHRLRVGQAREQELGASQRPGRQEITDRVEAMAQEGPDAETG